MKSNDDFFAEILAELKAEEKETFSRIRVGDVVVAFEDHIGTFSGTRMLTKGKSYTVISKDPKSKLFVVVNDVGEPGYISAASQPRKERP